MRLTIIGCSGSYPGPESPASCYLLEADVGDGDAKRTWRVLLDLGNGALGVLQRYADALSVDAVFFSHLHPDHCSDLCGFYVLRKYHPEGAQPRIPVYGPTGVGARMSEAYGLPDGAGMSDAFDFQEYAGPVEHPVEAYGLRITAGQSTIGYSGDTAPCEGLDRVAANTRLFLCEASFRDVDDNPPGVHLTGVDAGAAAARARAGRLVLTHVPPWFDRDGMLAEARTAFSGPVELAAVGATWEF